MKSSDNMRGIRIGAFDRRDGANKFLVFGKDNLETRSGSSKICNFKLCTHLVILSFC